MTNDNEICGETRDHEEVVDHEDDEVIQWSCRRCGAEGFVDKESDDG